MKSPLRLFAFFAADIAIALLLSGCGSDSNTNKFAYLQDNSTSVTTSLHHLAKQGSREAQTRLTGRNRVARSRVKSAAVDIATGTVDAYMMDAATGTATKLNSASAAYDSIALSHNGKKVVFTAYDSNDSCQVYVADVANSDSPTQLTRSTNVDHHSISISPDGTLIATTIDGATLSIIKIEDDTETILTPSDLVHAWVPSLSPDNSTIVFEGYTDAIPYAAGIYSMKVDGTALTRLTNAAGTYWDWDSSLSPDGKEISFIRENMDSGAADVYVVKIAGESGSSTATALTTDGYSLEAIHLASYVIFSSYRDTETGSGNEQLFRIKPDATGVKKLTTDDVETNFDLW